VLGIDGYSYVEWDPMYDNSLTRPNNFGMAPLSCINWMSPPHQDPFDWDNQPVFTPYLENAASNTTAFPLTLASFPTATSGSAVQAPTSAAGIVRPPEPSDSVASLGGSLSNITDGLSAHQSVTGSYGTEPFEDDTDETPATSPKGAFYIDGEGYRAPFRGLSRQRHSSIRISDLTNPVIEQDGDNERHASQANVPMLPRPTHRPTGLPTAEAYRSLLHNAKSESHRLAIDLDFVAFPSLKHVQAFVRMYFIKFHPIFPIIQRSGFGAEAGVHWLLLLAMSVVGASYVTDQQAAEGRRCLTRILWAVTLRQSRIAFSGEEMDYIHHQISPGCQVSVLQAYLLTITSMMASEESQARAISVLRYSAMESIQELGILASAADHEEYRGEHGDPEALLNDWTRQQAHIRSAFMFWVRTLTAISHICLADGCLSYLIVYFCTNMGSSR
jgi:hypothetical protein